MSWVPISSPEGVSEDADEQRPNLGSWVVEGDREATDDEKLQAYVEVYNRRNPDKKPITVKDVPNRGGVIGRVKELGRGMLDAVRDQFPEDIARAWQGGDVKLNDESLAERTIAEQRKDAEGRVLSRQMVLGDGLNEALYQGPRSIASSVTTGVAGNVAGRVVGGGVGAAVGSLVPGPGTAAGAVVGQNVGGYVGTAATSGTTFFRMAKNQFLHMIRDKVKRENINISEEDWDSIVKDVDIDATEYGLWEAGPGAASQVFTLSLFNGVGGKIFGKIPGFRGATERIAKRALTRVGAKYAAEVGEEEITEGVTFMGKGAIEKKHGLRDTDPTVGEFVREQAGAVAVGSVLQGGGYHALETMRAKKPAPAPGEHKDLLQGEPEAKAKPAPQAQDFYAEEAVRSRYQEEHSAAFPTASELFRQPENAGRGQKAPGADAQAGLGLGQGLTEDPARTGVTQDLLAQQPAPGPAAGGLGLDLAPEVAQAPVQPFSAQELAATAIERPEMARPSVWQAVGDEPAPVQQAPVAVQQGQLAQPAAVDAPQLHSSGDVLRSVGGRDLSPFPNPGNVRTERGTRAGLQRMDAWLLDEARREAADNDHVETLLSALDAKRLSGADRTLLNNILFGEKNSDLRKAQEAAAALPQPETILRADGKPFPTRQAAEAQAGVLRRKGQDVAVMPGEQGGFIIERGAKPFEQTDYGQKVSDAVAARNATALWELLRLDTNKRAREQFFRQTGTQPTKTQRDLRAAIDAWASAGEQKPEAAAASTQSYGLDTEAQQKHLTYNEDLRAKGDKVAHVVRQVGRDGKIEFQAYDDSGQLVLSKVGTGGRGIEALLVEKGYRPGNGMKRFKVPAGWQFSREYFEGGQPQGAAPVEATVEAPAAAQPQTPVEAPVESSVAAQPQAVDKSPEAAASALSPGFKVLAGNVTASLAKGEKFTWRELQAWANEAFGGTQAEGKWGIKEAYDAMEAGVNVYLMAFIGSKQDVGTADAQAMKAMVKEIEDKVLALLPTQTKRTEEQLEFQQFSTPPHLAAVAAWVCKPGHADVALEPSAGIGGLAIFARMAGAEVHVNELDPRRRGLLSALGFEHVTGENAEQLHNILPEDVKPTLIIMNPPFSATAGRMKGQRKTKFVTAHLDQALERLEPGGRMVAILSPGMGADKAHMAAWWKKTRAENTLRANVYLNGEIYKKYGTNFDNLLVVIDKVPPRDNDYVNIECKNLNEAIDALTEVRDARANPAERIAPEQGGSEGLEAGRPDPGPEPAARDAAGALGAGGGQGGSGGLPPGRDGGGAAVPGHARMGDPGDPGTGGNGRRGGDSGGVQSGDESGGPGRGDPGQHLVEPGAVEPGLPGRGQAEHASGQQVEIEAAEPADHDAGELKDVLFEPYRPQRIRVKGAKPHPTPLVQSAAMAAVEPPAATYAPRLPRATIESGALSEAQLEQVVYAGQAHTDVLPDGKRRGYFIGDGTGVGKGREISGIILDNWNQGRKKAVWITFNDSLFADAARDMQGVGDDPAKLFRLSSVKPGEAIKRKDGVLFTTYATLPYTPKAAGDAAKLKFTGGRLDQIEAWLGKDFDGVLVFDESHKMGNAIEIKTKGTRGTKKPAKQALAGVDLQKRLPSARVVYVSATGATEPSNLSYLERMGLWGEGTSFADKRGLIDAIESGGVAAMELVSRDMKAMGGYMARTLSFDGVTYSRLDHELTEYQRKAYDTYARSWQIVLDNVYAALEDTGQDKDSDAKGSAMSMFWGNHQRFFGQVLTSMTMPSVLKDIKAELAAGNSCVVQITNTNEAAQERALTQASISGEDLASLDITPRQMLMDYVRRAFPTNQFETYLDEDGNERSRVVTDAGGSPVENRQAVKRRDGLLEKLGALKVPGNPLDMIVEEIGPDMVAEVTGRSRRVILGKEERRGSAAGFKEAQDFMDGRRRVLVFSQAGGTGRSYHADRGAKNQQKRIHYILQPGWRADAATQGLGRTHRSNEAQPPHYKLVTTDLKGHKRFTSSIARRLDQLGALTQGQRQTGSQGLFSAADNLENTLAHDAWVWLAENIHSGKVPGVDYNEFVSQTGLVLAQKDKTGIMVFTPPPIKQFLNRLLSMTVDFQNQVFEAFESRLRDVYANAEAHGTLDTGMETLKAERIDVVGEEVLHTDTRSGAQTKALALKVHVLRDLMDHAGLLEAHGAPSEGWWRNKNSDKVYAAYTGGVKQNLSGEMEENVLLRGVNAKSPNRVSLEMLNENYEAVDPKEAALAWDKAFAGTEKTKERENWLLTGMLLPVWKQISGKANVYRLQDSQGQRHLGRLLTRDGYNQTRKNLGLGVDLPKYSPKQALAAILKGRKLTLRGGYELEARRVSGEVRVEITGEAVAWQTEQLKKFGAFSEIIQYKTRVFMPTGEKGAAFLERMLPLHPLVGDEQSYSRATADVHFSVRVDDGSQAQGMSLNKVRGAVQDMQARAKNARPLEVVQTFDELPKHIRRAARRQGHSVIEGVYDPREGKVWLVADGLTSRKRVVEVWMHEQCLHRGLRGLFGDDRRYGQFLRGVFESAGGRSAFREIADIYGFDLSDSADQIRAAEEYLARLMEKVRLDEALSAPEQRVWRKLVRFMKEMLNALGAHVTFTDEEIASFLKDAVYWTFEGERGAAKDPSLAHDLSEWARQLKAREQGTLSPVATLEVGRHTPDVYRRLGLNDLPLGMTQSKLNYTEDTHGIPAKDLEPLPRLLDSPLAVLDSATEKGTYLALLDMRDSKGRMVAAAIHPDVKLGRNLVNLVASVHGRKVDMAEWLEGEKHAGRLLYMDKKIGSPRLGDLSRLQLPGVAKPGGTGSTKKILTDTDIVKRDPDVKFSIPAPGESKHLDSALDKIGAPRTSVKDRVKALADQFRAEFEQGVFDRFASLRSVDEAAGANKVQDSAYVAARMTTSLGDIMTAIVQHGAPVWRDGAVDVDTMHQGLASVFAPVEGEVDRWCAWMVGKRAEKLMREGRENLFTPEEIQALKGLNAGRESDYDQVWRDYVRFKAKVMDFAEAAGVIDPAGRALWEHDEYIPFYRVTEEGRITGPRDKKGLANQTSGIKTLKGGTSNIGDPFENIMRNFTHLVDAGVKNHAMDLAMQNAVAAGAAHEAGLKWEAVKLSAGAMQASLRKVFGDNDAVWPMDEAKRSSLQNVFHLARPTGKDIVHVLKNGRPVYYQVGDPLLLRALTSINQAAWNNWAMQGARFFKRILTRGVTAMPDFMLRNLLRDTLSAWAVDNSGSFKPVAGSLRGLVKTLKQDADTVHMLAAGASFQGGHALGHDPAAGKLMVDRLMKKHGIDKNSVLDTPEKVTRFMGKAWAWWEEKGGAVENATRAEIYAKMRAKGATHLEAAYEAKNIMDYSMRGDWPAFRFLCEVVPFFGARLTGLHRLGRGYRENPRAFMMKGAMVALASTLLYLANHDDEEYQALEDFDRDNYYHFFMDGEHFRLPKPFEVGAIFGTLPERIVEQFVDDKATGALFAERLGYMLTQTFNVGFPQFAAPLVEEYANKSFFTGRPIVSRRLERLRPGAQRDPWTSATASELGKALDDSGLPLPEALRSPKRLEHLVNGYFGSMGMFVLSAADMATEALYDYPERPEGHVSDLPLVRSIYRDGPARNSKQAGELYEMIREIQTLYATVRDLQRTGDTERALELADANREKLGLRRAAGQVEQRLGEFNKRARQIHENKGMSPEEKRTLLDELTEKRNAYAKRAYGKMRERLDR